MILSIDASGGSDVVIERGCLARAGGLLDLGRRVLLVTDDGVPAEYVETVAAQCAEPTLVTVPRGEESKSLQRLEELFTTMLRRGFTRRDCVVSVGGGMVGDLAGFAAACYMRGVDFYSIPTTLLAQADASVGGKSAVNLDGVKNVVGAFRQPRRVLADADTLQTLSPRELSSGLAETVKAALIGDAALFELFETQPPAGHLEEIVAGALYVKKRFVEQDEREADARRALNFGHTVGHGIESATGLPHGACVALGMLAVSGGAVEKRLRAVLERLELPTEVSADRARVFEAMLHDKKAADGAFTVVRVDEPGTYRLERIAPEALRACVEKVVREA